MAKFKYKIAEAKETLRATDVDSALIQRIEKTYGPVDMENDFFSANLKTYFKTSSINNTESFLSKLSSWISKESKPYSS